MGAILSAFSASAVSTWEPSDNGLSAASYDPSAAGGFTAVTAGTIYLSRVEIRSAFTTSTVWWANQAGSGASTGSYVGLYDSTGTRVASTADVATQFTSSGTQSASWSSSAALSSGYVWVAFIANLATTQPNLLRSGNGLLSVYNVNLTAAEAMAATDGTALTALPATITPSGLTITGSPIYVWAGLS